MNNELVKARQAIIAELSMKKTMVTKETQDTQVLIRNATISECIKTVKRVLSSEEELS